jgi:hypothetical protein
MSETDEKGSHSAVGIVIAVLVLLPVLYVLSFGPVVTFLPHQPSWVVEDIYAPVLWLHDNTILEKPLEDYVEFWHHLFR